MITLGMPTSVMNSSTAGMQMMTEVVSYHSHLPCQRLALPVKSSHRRHTSLKPLLLFCKSQKHTTGNLLAVRAAVNTPLAPDGSSSSERDTKKHSSHLQDEESIQRGSHSAPYNEVDSSETSQWLASRRAVISQASAGLIAASIGQMCDQNTASAAEVVSADYKAEFYARLMPKKTAEQQMSALDSLESRVSTFTLANGMRWIVVERHAAPVIACHTYADVGASDEETGVTGIAHLLVS